MYRRDMPGRVGESSRLPNRTPRSSLSKQPSGSHSAQKGTARKEKENKKKKPKKKNEDTDDFYEIKCILAQERRDDGDIWYLVDWEDHKVTGEKYPHEWVHYTGVTLPAVAEWQNKPKKATREPTSSPPSDRSESPEESQPTWPKKRKLVSRAEITTERVRRDSPEPAESGAVSQGAEVSEPEEEPEIPDSYDQDRGTPKIRRRLDTQKDGAQVKVLEGHSRTEVGAPQIFNRSAYTAVNFSSSSDAPAPPTDFSSDLISSQVSHKLDQRQVTDKRISQSSSAPRPFIWDEDFEGNDSPGPEYRPSKTPEVEVEAETSYPFASSVPLVPRSSPPLFVSESEGEGEDSENEPIESLEVPDSQELRDSSAYKSSKTPSKTASAGATDTTTRDYTQANTQASLEAIASRNSQLYSSSSKQNDSGSIESQFAQRASAFDHESYTQIPEPTSAQVLATQTQSTNSSESRLTNLHLGNSASSLVHSLSGGPPVIANSPVSQSQDKLVFQKPADPPSEEDHSFGFQTQLPRVSCETESGEQLLPPSTDKSGPIDQDIGLQHELPSHNLEPAEEEQTPTEQRSELQQEPRSFSNFTDWQESKILSQSQGQARLPRSIPTPPGLLLSSSARRTQEYPIHIASPEDDIFQELPEEVPASQVAATQKSSGSKSSGHSQASSHLPSPPVEDLRPSIEETEEPLDFVYPTLHMSSQQNPQPSSSMEPTDSPNSAAPGHADEEVYDVKAMMKARMAAKRAKREADALKPSPTPALVLSNQNAVALNQTLPVQPPLEPSIPEIPSKPLFRSSLIGAAPIIEPALVGDSGSTDPTEEPATPPPAAAAMFPRTHTEEEDDEQESTSLSVLPLGRGEYEVPLPMTGYTRDVYVRRIKIYRTQLQSFLQDEVLGETLVAEVRSLVETLQTICSHPGLIDEEASQPDDHVLQAKWAENISTKFIFLAEFLELMRTTDSHIVILARPGQILDELESLLIFHAIDYSRVDRAKSIGTSRFRVTIYPAGNTHYSVDPVLCVFAFDSSYQTFPFLRQLRTHASNSEYLAPLIPLVITNSVDHVERCFNNSIEAVGRLIKVTSCVRQLMGRVGTFEAGDHDDPPDAASKVADYLISGPREGSWPLLPMPDIVGLDLRLLSSQVFSGVSPQDIELLTQVLQSGAKRHLETDEVGEILKRPRLRANEASGNGETDSSHVSESVPRTSPTLLPSRHVLSLAENERGQISSLLQRVGDLEAQFRTRDAVENELREINQDLESRCKDYETSIAFIQPKYQEALNDRGEFEHESRMAEARLIRLQKERDSKYAEVIKLREKHIELKAELSAAQTALSTSAIPEVAEFATLRDELAKSRQETERERKRYASANNELEYMREIFRNSSGTAAEQQAELQRIQTEVEGYREKAVHDKVHIQKIHSSNEITELRHQKAELTARVKDLERENEKKQQELLVATNGRRAKRGTSVPQSPRIGNQSSPAPRPMGRALHGGSRGDSPAPGDARNAGAQNTFPGSGSGFGDAMFPNSLPPAPPRDRWGQHLQQ